MHGAKKPSPAFMKPFNTQMVKAGEGFLASRMVNLCINLYCNWQLVEENMKHYYALFKTTADAIEVEFPDLEGCVTFGKDWEEALENAEDALAGWLAHANSQFIKEPSRYEQLEKLPGKLMPITVDEKIIRSYQTLKRFNVIFPFEILKKIDEYRKKKGLKRSTFLQKAAEEYLQQHQG